MFSFRLRRYFGGRSRCVLIYFIVIYRRFYSVVRKECRDVKEGIGSFIEWLSVVVFIFFVFLSCFLSF